MPTVHVDVVPKPSIRDPQGAAVERSLPGLGYDGVTGVRIGTHVELHIPDDADVATVVRGLAEELLANPVIEDYTWRIVDPVAEPTA